MMLHRTLSAGPPTTWSGGRERGILRPLSDEGVAPQVVQQLDGTPAEGTRNVQQGHYCVPMEVLARQEHHVADVVADGDRRDSIYQFSGQPQGRIPDRSRRTGRCDRDRRRGCVAASGSFPRLDAHSRRRFVRDEGILGPGYSGGVRDESSDYVAGARNVRPSQLVLVKWRWRCEGVQPTFPRRSARGTVHLAESHHNQHYSKRSTINFAG